MRKSTFWKFTRDFCETPKVIALAKRLNIPAYAAGALVALLYGWAVANADDEGNLNDYTDKAIETACMWDGNRGDLLLALHDAKILAGDLEGRSDDDPLRVSEWESVASDILTERRLSRERKQKYRAKDVPQPVPQDGTQDGTRDVPQPVPRPKNIEREHKNGEVEKANAAHSASRPRFSIPELKEISAYMAEYSGEKKMTADVAHEAERFNDYYSSNGWMVGKNKMRDWRAAARNWLERNKVGANTQRYHHDVGADIDDLESLYR